MSEAALDHGTAGRRRGRPPLASPFELLRTFTLIDSWQRTAFWLAQQEEVLAAELEKVLVREKVPPELWPPMRAVIGRHRPYDPAPGLTEAQQHQLAILAIHLDSKPREQWTQDDRRLDAERAKLLAKLHGKAVIRQIDDPDKGIEGGTSAPNLGWGMKRETPRYLCKLWRAFDEWGGRQCRMATKTFRDHRRELQRSDDPLFRWLQHEQGAIKPKQHRAR